MGQPDSCAAANSGEARIDFAAERPKVDFSGTGDDGTYPKADLPPSLGQVGEPQAVGKATVDATATSSRRYFRPGISELSCS
jgi:hypothetical protein